ncbi:MAG: sigma-54 dependent transcriptional regulator [Gemmatimonadota bacterium]|nr:sigma-54 dependent transcriptional regulator [Gemmatimonadota bacterium]
MASRILIADDQPDVVEALRLLLVSAGFELEAAGGPEEALARLENGVFDAALIDLNYTRDTTSGREGLDLLRMLHDIDSTLPVVVMTAWGSVDSAVEAMRRGARDYIEKPWDNDRLLATLKTQIQLGRALRRSQKPRNGDGRSTGPPTRRPRLIAASKAMKPVLKMMRRVAPSDANILITGEHGTGKEVVAGWLHASSARRLAPLVTVNMGGISEGVFESELFGHVKGAFTDAKSDRAGFFELAHGGTLFLDEIANTSLPAQAKLLRVLETGELQRVGSSDVIRVDVRLLSATNASLDQAVAEGRFREDLLYRINTVEIPIPPLRDRPEDLPLLAAHFLKRDSVRYGRPGLGFTSDASRALVDHPWPGNVRELKHAVERAVLMSDDPEIGVEDLALRTLSGGTIPLEELKLGEVERLLIERAMDRHDGNVSRAAERLGLSRSALYRRLARYRIDGAG